MRKVCLAVFLCFVGLLQAQNDCVDAIVVCGDTGFEGLTATGVGLPELDPTNVCSSEENNSIWLKLSIGTSGTLAFTLFPESTDIEEDFDFWLFGPNVTCSAIGTSIRCSTTNPLASGAPNNLTGMNTVETDTSEGPGEFGNNFVQAVNANAGETYFLVIDRPVGFSNFSLQWTGTATFNQQPNLPPLSAGSLALTNCDNDGVSDGKTPFNLSQNDSVLLGTQSGVSVTYHLNSNDAITGTDPITNVTAYTNTVNPQTIYARLTNVATGCFNTTQFDLTVTTALSIPNDHYTICDDGADGSSSNGLSSFHTNDITAALFPGIDTSTYTISYFANALNAASSTAAFGTIFNNTIPNEQSVFVKAESLGGCFAIKEIFLRVQPLPTTIPATLNQCDSAINPDGISTFDLSDAIAELTGNDPNLTVAFFETGNPNPIGPIFQNATNPQTLSAKITSLVTGCTNTSSLTLRVNAIVPRQLNIEPQCDLLGVENGIRSFDLNDCDLVLSTGQTVAFYRSEQDALLEVNRIADPSDYSNPVPYHATVFVRVNDGNDCMFINELQLNVNELPAVIRTSENHYLCEDLTGDSVVINAAITEGNPSDYHYQWYLDGNLLPLNDYEIEVRASGTYTVRVSKRNCSIDRTIPVVAAKNAIIKSIVVNDFTAENKSIAISLSNPESGNYTFSLDNPNGPFQESPFFEHVNSGLHQLYIKEENACGIEGPININVLGIPKFFTPNGDDYNDIWRISGIDPKVHHGSTIEIFNRQGQLLKQISAVGEGWDGKCNGEALPAEDYWYHISMEDGRTAIGHFSLKR